MNKKLKQLIKKHVNEIKSMDPEVYIEIEEDGDEIFISVGSHKNSDEERYEDLIDKLNVEYDKKGYYYVYWGDNDSLTCDNLVLLEDIDRIPMNENSQEKKVVNF